MSLCIYTSFQARQSQKSIEFEKKSDNLIFSIYYINGYFWNLQIQSIFSDFSHENDNCISYH